MSRKFADQGIGGDAYPAETPEAVVERQHVNDSYGQDSQFDDHPIAEYKFFFANGELDVSGAHDLDSLRERNNVPPEHNGPTAVGNLIVQDGTAIWEVVSNVSLGALVKALKKYTKDAGWDWGGITNMKGEPLGDPEKLARKRYWVTLHGGRVQLWTKEPDRPAASDTGRLDVVGRVAAYRPFISDRFPVGTAEMNTLIKEALSEFANDHNLKLAEYPGGGSMTDQLRNHPPLGEDLELKNIYAERPETRELERFHKDRDRTPEGIFNCPGCGRLFHRWHEYLVHRQTEEPPGEPVEDGKFPTVEESMSTPLDPIEARVANVVVHDDPTLDHTYRTDEGNPNAPLAMIYDADNDTLNIGAHDDIHHGDMWPKINGDECYAGWASINEQGHQWYDGAMPEETKQRATGLLHQHLGYPTKDLDEESGWSFESKQWTPQEEDIEDFMLGQCAAWAAAHHEVYPHLRFGIDWQKMSDDDSQREAEENGEDWNGEPIWQAQHIFTHDDTHAYDVEGAHPLPYQQWDEVTLDHSREDVESTGMLEPGYMPDQKWMQQKGVRPRSATERPTPSEIESKFLHGARRLAIKQPKDMFTEPVPFIYDIELDRIFVGHPGARHAEIEAPAGTKFTPGGIVEGEYQPGGKVVVESQSDTPYSVRHLVGLWYYQHPEFEVTGIMMTMPDGKQRKIASTVTKRWDPRNRAWVVTQDGHVVGSYPNKTIADREIAKLEEQEQKVSSSNIGAYVIGQAAQDPAVHAAWTALQKVGGEVYGVGGVVRDALLGKPSKDVDLLVTGLPAERVDKTLRKLPGRVDLTGKDFGVFRYNHDGYEVEVALPRTEKSTGERRVDFDVSVDHTLPVETDLQRRDFTANAIAVNLRTGEVVDPYGGADDIANKRLRTVHDNSFPEDPTRLVRGLVAHSRHDLHPDPKTLRQMQAHAPDLAKESAERIQAELDKLFSSDNPGAAIRLAHKTGMLKYLLPEVEAAWNFNQNNKHHTHTLGEHLVQVLDNISEKTDDPDLRLAALLHDIGKPGAAWTDPETGQSHFYRGPNNEGANHDELGASLAAERLSELRHPTKRTQRIEHLIRHHMYPDFSSPKGARKFLNQVGPEHAHDLMLLREADRSGKGTDEYQATKTPVDVQRRLVDEALEAKVPTNRSALAINGNDLMGLGLQPGPAFSQILQSLTELVLEHPELNEKHSLLNYVRHELMPSA